MNEWTSLFATTSVYTVIWPKGRKHTLAQFLYFTTGVVPSQIKNGWTGVENGSREPPEEPCITIHGSLGGSHEPFPTPVQPFLQDARTATETETTEAWLRTCSVSSSSSSSPFIGPVIEQYAHLHQYNWEEQDRKGPTTTLTAAIKRSITQVTGYIFYHTSKILLQSILVATFWREFCACTRM